ncbi:hypothetical protein H2509_00225 [Stappia sp. F7233]|uniref:Transcriptional regulator-like domain-containing protein n=1 Tax=Stappia albiluteola TaxID=2758565 RepID=A0A839A8K0_9HYPH|nr:DUF6499 domain-containing protein [Stappia albiluteola]MBA5775546.1 hypothetical protein [Stappia albiluteola]
MKEVSEETSFEDWRDCVNYRHLLNLDRADWAWEFLRRHPDCPSFLIMPRSRQVLRAAPPINLVTLEEELDHAPSWGLRFRRYALLTGFRIIGFLAR